MSKENAIYTIVVLTCLIAIGVLISSEFGWKIGVSSALAVWILMPQKE